MISKAQITKIADRDGVEAKVVERDYALAHLVAMIASHPETSCVVFKGGTSLRLLHYLDYRYSADLDFSVVKGDEEAARVMIRNALKQTRQDSLGEVSLDGDRISYVGPLGAKRTVKLDLADDELVINTEDTPLLRRWQDLPDVSIRAYTKLEVTAEKLRCVLQRLQCRDLLDLDLLLPEEDPTSVVELFKRKAIHRKIDPATFEQRFEKRMKDYEKNWERELAEYLSEVPHFDEVNRNVRRALRRAALL